MQLSHFVNVCTPALEYPNSSLCRLGHDCNGAALALQEESCRECADGWHELGYRLRLCGNDLTKIKGCK